MSGNDARSHHTTRPADRPEPHGPTGEVHRRALLGGTAGGALLAGGTLGRDRAAAQPRHHAPAADPSQSPDAARRQRFAFVTDVHVNDLEPERVTHFRRVTTAILADDPELVISGGDMTDWGRDAECEAYWSAVPDTLRSRMHHVPGNHELKYDWSDYANYERWFGERNVAVDVGGLHFLFVDTSVFQLDPAYLRHDTMTWLRDTLEAAGSEPSIIVTHHPPMGDRFYFLPNQDELHRVIEPYPVRGILCGHTHAQRVLRTNGLTLLVGRTAKKHAGFYRLERTTDDTDDRIEISYVEAPEPGTGGPGPATPVTTIDLTAPHGPGGDLAPTRTRVRCSTDGTLAVRARYPREAPVADVAATVYNPDVFRGNAPDTWTPLTGSDDGALHTGQLTLDGHAPGDHRVIIRSRDAAGDQWREIVDVQTPATAFDTLWEHRMPESVQGSLAQHDGLVVIADTTGRVVGCRPTGSGRGEQWSTELGHVYNDATFSPDGSTVYVPAADGLHALDADDGSRRWRADLGPVLADPCVATVDGAVHVVVAAGLTMHCVDDTGTGVWSIPLEFMTAGRPAVVDGVAYFGGGDGDAWAVDVRTGETQWRVSLTEGTKDRLTEAPWTTNVLPLPNGLLLFSTRAACLAVDPERRAIAWQSPGNYMYCPPTLIEGRLLAVGRLGNSALLDPDDGTVLWEGQPVPDARAPGQLRHGRWIYLTASSGMIARIDAQGTVEQLRQVNRGFVYATPALADDGRVLVHADQAGFVRGLTMPED